METDIEYWQIETEIEFWLMETDIQYWLMETEIEFWLMETDIEYWLMETEIEFWLMETDIEYWLMETEIEFWLMETDIEYWLMETEIEFWLMENRHRILANGSGNWIIANWNGSEIQRTWTEPRRPGKRRTRRRTTKTRTHNNLNLDTFCTLRNILMLWNSVCAPAAAAPEIFVKFVHLHKKNISLCSSRYRKRQGVALGGGWQQGIGVTTRPFHRNAFYWFRFEQSAIEFLMGIETNVRKCTLSIMYSLP